MAVDSGKIIGFYLLAAEGSRLEHLWIVPDRIGTGVGRKLFNHAVRQAAALGASTMEIEADPHAEGFYKHMGAKRAGEVRSQVLGMERVIPQLTFGIHADAAPASS